MYRIRYWGEADGLHVQVNFGEDPEKHPFIYRGSFGSSDA